MTVRISMTEFKFFDKDLLKNALKLNDDETDLWKIWECIQKKLWKKLEYSPGKKKKCEELKQRFMELYESIKTQKENGQTKTRNKTQMPFYHIEHPRHGDQEIFFRLKYGNS